MDATNFTPAELLFIRAKFYNPDYGTSVLEELLNDPSCDQATALLIYWQSWPGFYYGYATEEELPDWSLDSYKLMKKAEHLLLEGRFPEEIRYTPDEDYIPKDPGVLSRIPQGLLAGSNGTMDSELLTLKYIHAEDLIEDCREGHPENARKRLEVHPDLLNIFIGDTNPLLAAIGKGNVELVTYLLEKGALVDATPLGRPRVPVVMAFVPGKMQQQQILELLVAHGADINATNPIGNGFLHKQLDRTPKNWKEHYGPNLLKATLKLGADPHLRNAAGKTPLVLAAEHHNEAALKILHDHLEKTGTRKTEKP